MGIRHNPDSIEGLIEYKTANGDFYPAFANALQRAGFKSRRFSDQNVNIASSLGSTDSGWIGLNLFVMCPDAASADEIVGALMAVLASYGWTKTATATLEMLSESKRETNATEEQLWPKGASPLKRSGGAGPLVRGQRV